MMVIPAVDLMGGECVRLTKGDFETSVTYSSDPLEIAHHFEDAGFHWLHMVDLDGAKTGSPAHLDTLRSIKSNTSLKVDFGGGLRGIRPVEDAFDSGADLVTVGSAAIRNPHHFAEWMDRFGPNRFILAADVSDDRIAVSGWQESSGRRLWEAVDEFVEMGLVNIMITDISRDGTLSGPATKLYNRFKSRFPDLFLIASGGVGDMDDVTALVETGCDAAIVGKAIYEGRIRLDELAVFVN
jgi:phosphoribosylformimino-5-aminoimidazole carboxamide ribotide isomerase